MAKLKTSTVIGWGIVVFGSYVLYQKARTGDFCAPGTKGTDRCYTQKFAEEIHKALGQLTIGWGKQTVGGAGDSTMPATTTPSIPTGGSYAFIPGQRYVAYDPVKGMYYVYWFGDVKYYNTQTEAEQAYNRLIEQSWA